MHELRDGEVFDQGDVRQTAAGLGRVVECGVGLVGLADVAHLHRDVRIGLHEGFGGAIDAGVPRPYRQFGLARACGRVAASRERDEQGSDGSRGYDCARGVVMLVFFPCLTVSGRSNYFVWTSSIMMYRDGKLVKTPAFSYCQSPDGRYSESRSRMTPGCLSR